MNKKTRVKDIFPDNPELDSLRAQTKEREAQQRAREHKHDIGERLSKQKMSEILAELRSKLTAINGTYVKAKITVLLYPVIGEYPTGKRDYTGKFKVEHEGFKPTELFLHVEVDGSWHTF